MSTRRSRIAGLSLATWHLMNVQYPYGFSAAFHLFISSSHLSSTSQPQKPIFKRGININNRYSLSEKRRKLDDPEMDNEDILDDDDDDDDDDDTIEALRKLAMTEDEEWFNTFIRDVLDEDEIDSENRSKRVVGSTKSSSTNEDSLEKSWNVSKPKSSPPPPPPPPDSTLLAREDGSTAPTSSSSSSPSPVAFQETNSDGDGDPSRNRKAVDRKPKEITSTTKDKPDDTNETNVDLVVEFQDIYDSSKMVRVPLVQFQTLGYEPKDLLALRPNALDLILEDEIPKPEKGLPKRWLRIQQQQQSVLGDPMEMEETHVRILKRRKKSNESVVPSEKHTAQTISNRRREKSSLDSTNEILDDDDDDDDDDDNYNNNYAPSFKSKSRKIRNKRLEKISSRIPDDDANKNRFWMDLPTFKKYLRKEAQMRLSILGSDWRDWVRGESDWRYQLYKTWLDVLDGGIGDDMFEDTSDARAYVRNSYPDRRDESRRSKRNDPPYRTLDIDKSKDQRRDDADDRKRVRRGRDEFDPPDEEDDFDQGRSKRRRRRGSRSIMKEWDDNEPSIGE